MDNLDKFPEKDIDRSLENSLNNISKNYLENELEEISNYFDYPTDVDNKKEELSNFFNYEHDSKLVFKQKYYDVILFKKKELVDLNKYPSDISLEEYKDLKGMDIEDIVDLYPELQSLNMDKYNSIFYISRGYIHPNEKELIKKYNKLHMYYNMTSVGKDLIWLLYDNLENYVNYFHSLENTIVNFDLSLALTYSVLQLGKRIGIQLEDSKNYSPQEDMYNKLILIIYSFVRRSVGFEVPPEYLKDINDNEFNILKSRLPDINIMINYTYKDFISWAQKYNMKVTELNYIDRLSYYWKRTEQLLI